MLSISRSTYYRYKKRGREQQSIAEQVVKMVRYERQHLPRIGGRKLYYLLKSQLQPLRVGRDKFFTILRANHLLIRPKRSYHMTTQSRHHFRKHRNLIEDLSIHRPEQVWVSDITYLGQRDNPMYLALVTDAYSKKIMGHDVSDTLAASSAQAALNKAIKARQYPQAPLIHHSDRGLQYCCDAYQAQLVKANIQCSMTEAYDPYQNAVAERINGILKQEFLDYYPVRDLRKMQRLAADSIKRYNEKRPHYSCYYHTPAKTHQQCQLKIRTYRTKKVQELSEESS